MLINEIDLALIKEEVLLDLKKLVAKLDIDELAMFNKGYLNYRKNPYEMFVLTELNTWNSIVDFYAFQRKNDCKGILDIGAFIPYYPTVLKRIGFEVEVVEKISLYGKSFDPIVDYLNSQNIKIHNIDVIKEPLDLLPLGFDVLLIAILEHLNGTPRILMNKIKTLMSLDSLLYIHVPNICKLSNIINLLRGKSILPLYKDYFFSKYPFEGHNREMTLEELLSLCEFSSLEVVKKGRVIKPGTPTIKNKIFNIVKSFVPKYSDSVYVIGRKLIKDSV